MRTTEIMIKFLLQIIVIFQKQHFISTINGKKDMAQTITDIFHMFLGKAAVKSLTAKKKVAGKSIFKDTKLFEGLNGN